MREFIVLFILIIFVIVVSIIIYKTSNNRKLTFYAVLLIIWMIIIFLLSNQAGSESTALTNGFMDKLLILFKSHISNDSLLAIMNYLFIPIRKIAHFVEYMILGILSYKTFSCLKIDKKKLFIYSLLLSMIYSQTDELHQLFVPGRGCSIFDFMIDSLGALTAIYIMHKKTSIKR